MHVLLTGALGKLGRAAIAELVERGHTVRCFDVETAVNRRHARALPAGATACWGDIRDRESVQAAVQGCEAVIHNAAVLPPASEQHPELAEAVNVQGTRLVLEAMAEQPGDPLLIFSSSVVVFGRQQHKAPPRRVDEPLDPVDNYSRHKAACEAMIQQSKVRWVILRIGVALDPTIHDTNRENFRMLFDAALETRMEYVHNTDVAFAQVQALDCADAWRKILLIGGGPDCQITQRELLGSVCEALGIEMFPDEAFTELSFYTDWLDTEESQRLLAYQRHTWAQYSRALSDEFRTVRWLIWPVRPLLRNWILGFSSRWKARS